MMRTPLILGITLIGLAIVGGAGYFGYRSIQSEMAPTPEPPKTIPVQRGDVKLTVTAPGQLAGVRTETVRAPAASTLLEVAVRAGDRVKKNDVIARLDPEPMRTTLDNAEAAVANARDSLAGQVNSAEEQVNKAEDTLHDLRLNYPTESRVNLELAQAQDAYDTLKSKNNKAKSAVDSARKTRDARKSALDAANKKVSSAQAACNTASSALSASQAAQALAQGSLNTAQASQAAAQSAYDQAVTDGADQSTLDTLQAALQAANQAVADAQTTLDAANAQVQTDQQAVNDAQATLQSAQTAQSAAQTPYNAAEADYQSAKLAYQQTQSTLSSADYSVQFAQLAVDGLKTQQQSADIQIDAAKRAVAEANNSLAKARAQTIDASLTDAVEKARLALANATLHASFDGIVKEVDHQAGEDISKDEALAVILDPGVLEVSSTVVEEDLPLIKIGQKADLFFDAAPDATITGEIDRIVPERTAGSDSTVYTVFIRISDPLPAGLLPGMTVDGSIIIDQRLGVLVLPRALVRAGGSDSAIVEVWDGEQRQKRTVKIGLRGDVNIEIVDGLHEGELVVSE
jgi:HlyD family secretion protein